jgi:hypothetical protein
MDDKLKMQVRVQPMAGSSTYIPLLNRGEVDFGLTNVDDAMTAFKGGQLPSAQPRHSADRGGVPLNARCDRAERLADQEHQGPQGQDHALGLQRADHGPRPCKRPRSRAKA